MMTLQDGRLADLRVLEFTAGMAGPWVGRFMATSGAEVIRVESETRPDVTRLYVSPRDPEAGVQPECSPWFTDWNAGKRFVSLNLTKRGARELVYRLVAKSDVVVENYRAGALQALGLSYEDLIKYRYDLVMLSTTGFGQDGPHSRYVTWGPNVEALSGLAHLSGFLPDVCTMTQYAYPDALGALHGLFAVLAALDYREKTGLGQYIDLSQLEATVAAMGDAFVSEKPSPRGNRSDRYVPNDCYRCRGEDRWCAITVKDDAEWRRLCEVMGRPDVATDPRFANVDARSMHIDEMDSLLSSWTSKLDAFELMELLQAVGIAAGVVQNVEDQWERDPQLAARGFFEHIPHTVKGEVIANGIPLGFSDPPARTPMAGGAVGEANDHVFRDLLGLSEEEFEDLISSGAIETPVV